MLLSIGIYLDKKGNLLIVPNAFDENGCRKNMNKYEILDTPFTNEEVGKRVQICFEAIKSNPYINSKDVVLFWEVALGIKSYSKFAKDRLRVSVTFENNEGFKAWAYKRGPHSSYITLLDYKSFEANAEASNEEIGELVMKAFEDGKQIN